MINTNNDTSLIPIDYQLLRNKLINYLYKQYADYCSGFWHNREYNLVIKYSVKEKQVFDFNSTVSEFGYNIRSYKLSNYIYGSYDAKKLTYQFIAKFVNDLTLQELFTISYNELSNETIEPYIFHAFLTGAYDYNTPKFYKEYEHNEVSDLITERANDLVDFMLAHLSFYLQILKHEPLQIDSVFYLIYKLLSNSKEISANVYVLINQLVNLLQTLPDYQSGMVFDVLKLLPSDIAYELPFRYLIRFSNWFDHTSDHGYIKIDFILDNSNELSQLINNMINNRLSFINILNLIEKSVTSIPNINVKTSKNQPNIKASIDAIGNDDIQIIKLAKEMLYKIFNV